MRAGKLIVCLKPWLRLAVAIFAVGLTVLHGQAQEAEPVHIGILAPLSGPFERLGRQVERGVEFALQSEGLVGQAVRVTAVDDRCDEETGRDAANQLIGAGVDIVVGGVCWRPAAAARDVLAFEQVPFVATGVRYGPFTDGQGEGLWRVSGRDDQQADVLADAVADGDLDQLAGLPIAENPIVVFFTDGNYGRNLADGLEDRLRDRSVSIALKQAFQADDNFAELARLAQAEGAAIVFVFAGQADSALLVEGLRSVLSQTAVVAGDSVMTAEFRLLADGASDGVVFARPTPWSSLVGAQSLAVLRPEQAEPLGGLAISSIAGTQMAFEILEGGQGPFDTILGPLEFKANGDLIVPSFELWQWRDGLIWPLHGAPLDEG